MCKWLSEDIFLGLLFYKQVRIQRMNQPHTLTLDDVIFDKSTGAINVYTGEYKNIVIPDNFNGTPVTSILNSAFGYKELIGVTIPDSVMFIDYNAFKGNFFTKIIFPQPKVSISYHAFDDGVVKIVDNNNPKCLDFQDNALNIFNNGGTVTNEIYVDHIDSLESLNIIADTYVKLSELIDENIFNHSVCIEHSSLEYSIYVVTKDGLCDETFFEHFIGNPTLESKAVHFINNVNTWCRKHKFTIWQNDEQPLAEHAAYALSMHDEKYIPLYCEVLLLNDMDHECYQAEHIESLIEKHGLCENILLLIALRLGGARGQFGSDHIHEHQEEIFELCIKNPEMKSFFLNAAVKSIYDAWGDHDDVYHEFFEYVTPLIDGDNESWLAEQLQLLKNNILTSNSIDALT